jgi:hypothetical protein
MNNPSAPLPYLEVADYLEAEGVAGGDTGWTLFTGFLPTSPHRAVAVFPAGGLAPEAKNPLRHPQVQVRVRGNPQEQTAPYEKVEEVLAALRRVRNQVLGAGYYAHLLPASDVLALGQDQSQRFEYTVTFRAARSAA